MEIHSMYAGCKVLTSTNSPNKMYQLITYWFIWETFPLPILFSLLPFLSNPVYKISLQSQEDYLPSFCQALTPSYVICLYSNQLKKLLC